MSEYPAGKEELSLNQRYGNRHIETTQNWWSTIHNRR